ncbi:monovalent cation/H(+) antiporter subunit G [Rhodobaculum claviforme]|uniref:Sodium:proton antiporter n=1 Tax=Rhodobaculum claviforme TaxID=1549854 RepID=A0A934TIQ9_9RHOB|nr:monovalent cation/H(+) antiporter subunit G [Rhodobaculum claviforme]MBK5926348.1 sodium:proton antiporter [Rhodobaculum claviforme]
MIEVLAGLLVLAGAGFTLIAAIGILRYPDLLTRMHASTKAGTLGSILVLAAMALVLGTMPVVAKTIATVLFLLLTAPIAAHMIGRAYVRTEKTPAHDTTRD